MARDHASLLLTKSLEWRRKLLLFSQTISKRNLPAMFRIDNDVLIATLPERLDTNNAPATESAVVSEIDKGLTRVVIDCSNTTFISSAGLRVILKVAKLLHKQNGALALCGLNEEISEVFEISGFLTLVNVFPSLTEAMDAVKA